LEKNNTKIDNFQKKKKKKKKKKNKNMNEYKNLSKTLLNNKTKKKLV